MHNLKYHVVNTATGALVSTHLSLTDAIVSLPNRGHNPDLEIREGGNGHNWKTASCAVPWSREVNVRIGLYGQL